MTPIEITLFMLLGFLIVLFLGHPLMSTLGGLAVIFGFLFWGDGNILAIFARTSTKTATTISYVCIPLFIFMGCILERSGVSEKLFEAMYVVLGRLRGGLGLATVLICALMGAATGIIGASITIMGMLALPSMVKYRYNSRMAAGTVMAAGSLGTMIPPSVILVIYGSLAQLSIAKLFAGGLTVGLLLAGLYMAYIVVRTLLDKNAGPPINPEESARYSLGE
jgi:tripartite ATP-independent transporter DctM subunit